MNTASMWLAYQKKLSVPAYNVVSCTENPTPSRARMMRLLRQFSVLMSSSVSVTSSRVRTIMDGVLLCGVRFLISLRSEERRVGQDGNRGWRPGEQMRIGE